MYMPLRLVMYTACQRFSLWPSFISLFLHLSQVCPGGGFGPVSDHGYGVSYMLPGDARIFFHVSSKKFSTATDSKRFMQNLFDSLAEMKSLFETKGEKGEKVKAN